MTITNETKRQTRNIVLAEALKDLFIKHKIGDSRIYFNQKCYDFYSDGSYNELNNILPSDFFDTIEEGLDETVAVAFEGTLYQALNAGKHPKIYKEFKDIFEKNNAEIVRGDAWNLMAYYTDIPLEEKLNNIDKIIESNKKFKEIKEKKKAVLEDGKKKKEELIMKARNVVMEGFRELALLNINDSYISVYHLGRRFTLYHNKEVNMSNGEFVTTGNESFATYEVNSIQYLLTSDDTFIINGSKLKPLKERELFEILDVYDVVKEKLENEIIITNEKDIQNNENKINTELEKIEKLNKFLADK